MNHSRITAKVQKRENNGLYSKWRDKKCMWRKRTAGRNSKTWRFQYDQMYNSALALLITLHYTGFPCVWSLIVKSSDFPFIYVYKLLPSLIFWERTNKIPTGFVTAPVCVVFILLVVFMLSWMAFHIPPLPPRQNTTNSKRIQVGCCGIYWPRPSRR